MNAWGIFVDGKCVFALKFTQQATIDAAAQLGLDGGVERVYIKPTSERPTGWAAVETKSGDFVAAMVGVKDSLLDALDTLGHDSAGLELVRMKFTEARKRK